MSWQDRGYGVADAKWDTSHGDGYQWNTSDKVTTSASGNYTGAIGDLENGTGTGGNDAAVNGHYKNGAGAGGEGGGDNPCRNCGQPGHFARECSEPRKQDGDCFNCGEPGHSKAECPNPRVFKGSCRLCEKEGHPASACPEKPAEICKNCKKEGHRAVSCTDNRVLDLSNVANKVPDDAWRALQVADKDRDLDEFREALKVYSKAVPDTTYDELEHAFRQQGFQVYLIASARDKEDAYTLVNLQGKLDCEYHIVFNFSPNPKRAREREGWPASPAENLERLKDAGIPMDRGVPKCSNCDEMGHTAKNCKEEKKVINDRIEVKCVNCEEAGHRARDCLKPRTDRFACRNCKQSGHTSAECTEPRSAEGVECKHCQEIGHFAKDCPTKPSQACRNCGQEGHISKECDQPRNPATVTCRNCEQMGHFSKDCPEPKDWSKVKCSNCGEMGHTIKRCKQPVPGADATGENAHGGSVAQAGDAVVSGEWNSGPAEGPDW